MDHVIQSKPGLLTIMKGWYSSTKEDHNMRWTHGLPNVMKNYCCYKGRMVQKHMNITVIFGRIKEDHNMRWTNDLRLPNVMKKRPQDGL